MTQTLKRCDLVDVLRGTAIAMMLVFHFCFELKEFEFVGFDFYNTPFWLHFRTLIVSMFLLIVGISLHLAYRSTLNKAAFVKRLSLLMLYAALVTLSTYLVEPGRMVFFGILHFVTVASVVGLLFAGLFWINLILGIALILVGGLIQLSIFNQPVLQWFGLMTYKPYTGDYVPLLPWFGVVLLGLFTGRVIFNHKIFAPIIRWRSKSLLTQTLAWAGRYSLHIYIVHIPIFIALLSAVSWVIKESGVNA